MVKKLVEYVQIEDINQLRNEISRLNYKLVNAINETNIIKELLKEKNRAIRDAKDISKSLIPEIDKLNDYFFKNDESEGPAKPLTSKVRAAHKDISDTREDALSKLKKRLATVRRQRRK